LRARLPARWENWRTRAEYSDALIIKSFLFQAVNSYVSLFYVAFLQANSISLWPGMEAYCHNLSDFEQTEEEIKAAHHGRNPNCMGALATQVCVP